MKIIIVGNDHQRQKFSNKFTDIRNTMPNPIDFFSSVGTNKNNADIIFPKK